MTQNEQHFEVGQELAAGRFRIEEMIGEGSIGQVYRAEDSFLGQKVALKTMIRVLPEYILSLKNEFRMLAGLSHPNLVQFYELFANETPPFMTMELLEGRNLLEAVWEGRQYPGFSEHMELRMANSFAQLVAGIEALHRAGKIHRDIKPSNVMVMPDERLVILDFGLATTAYTDESVTAGVGTPRFWAPEQISGSPLPASDWFSVGACLYYALGGMPLPQKVYTDANPNYDFLELVPERYHDVLKILLSHDPEQRGTGKHLATILDELATAVPSTTQYVADATPVVFVGRDAELQRLEQAYLADKERPRITHIVGESGIGKSELLRHFTTSMQDQGIIVLQGACRQNESVDYRALDPIVDELARFLKSLSPDETLMMVPRFAGPLLQLFPVLASVRSLARAQDTFKTNNPNEMRQRAMQGLQELLLRLSDRRPIVLWIDDAQWGDEDSAALLGQIVTGAMAPPVYMIVSSRPETPPGVFIRSLHERAQQLDMVFTEVPLRALPEDAIADLVAAIDVHGQPDAVERIIRSAGGSPFLASELARLARSSMEAVGPTTLVESVALRLQELSEAGRSLVELTAVAGHPIDAKVALSMLQHADHGLVYELCNQRWLTRSADDWQLLSCYHQQIADAVVQGLGAEAASWHERIAVALSRVDVPDWARVTEHYLKSGAGEAAIEAAAKAAAEAMEKYAFQQAAGFYRLIAEDKRGTQGYAKALRDWADALKAAGHSNAAGDVLLQLAGESADAVLQPRIKMEATAEFLKGGRVATARAIMLELLPVMGIEFPEPGLPSMLYSASRRLMLMLRYLRGDFLPRLRSMPRPQEPDREIEALQDLADFMGPLDSSVADVIMVRVLKLVLQRGSLAQVRRRLVLDVSRQMLIGPPYSYMAPRVLKNALQLSRNVPTTPTEQTTVFLAIAAYHEWLGDPPERRVGWLQRGERSLACVRGGVDWIRVHIDWTMFIPLLSMCQFGEISRRFSQGFDDARQRGDVLAMANYITLGGHYAFLIEDRPAYGNAQIEEINGQLEHAEYLIQHFYGAISAINNHLYTGEWEKALACAREHYPKVKQAGYFRLGILGDRFRLAYAKAAARAAYELRDGGEAEGLSAVQLARMVKSELSQLTKIIPANAAHQQSLLATTHLVNNHTERAIGCMQQSIEQFSATGEQCFARCMQVRLAEYSGDAQHAAAGAQAKMALLDDGVVNPERFAAALCPV